MRPQHGLLQLLATGPPASKEVEALQCGHLPGVFIERNELTTMSCTQAQQPRTPEREQQASI